MWIVRLALRRPYTFIVLAMLIVLMGVTTVLRMPADMFPQINIPVVAAIWQFTPESTLCRFWAGSIPLTSWWIALEPLTWSSRFPKGPGGTFILCSPSLPSLTSPCIG